MTLAPGWPDLAGRIEGGAHRLPLRVYFEDTDFSGLVYHGSYLRWCERARSDFLRLLGIHHRDLAAAPVPAAFAVRRLTLDFLKPAHIDEQLEVATVCTEITAATLRLCQKVERDGQILATADVLVVLLSAEGRPLRLPKAIISALGKAA